MKKIAFVRSIEIQKTEPYLGELGGFLKNAGIRAKLFYTDGECAPGDFPGDAERLPKETTAAEIADKIRNWEADGAISLSMPDENSLRDSLAGHHLAKCGIPMVTHPVDVTLEFANKWRTKGLLEKNGLETPDGTFVDGDLLNHRVLPVPAHAEWLVIRAEELGYPLLAKPLWDSLGNGIRFIRDEAAFREFLAAPIDGNFVLEKFIVGELCSVEVLGAGDVYVSQPLVWKGRTAPDQYFPFDNVRYVGPRPTHDAKFIDVAAKLEALAAKLQLNGAIEVEMIYAEGAYRVIEVNPRVSGTTTISIAASGINTYVELTKMLLGAWRGATSFLLPTERWVFEFPIGQVNADQLRQIYDEVSVVRASTYRYLDKLHSSIVLTCERGEEDKFLSQLSERLDTPGLMHPSILPTVREILQ